MRCEGVGGELSWLGGAEPGRIALHDGTVSNIVGDRLVLTQHTPHRSVQFRAAAGGPSLLEWHVAITNILTPPSLPGAALPVLEELMATERAYVAALVAMNSVIAGVPLQGSESVSRPSLTLCNMAALRNDDPVAAIIEPLLRLHTELLSLLERAGTSPLQLAVAFVTLAPYLRMYALFCSGECTSATLTSVSVFSCFRKSHLVGHASTQVTLERSSLSQSGAKLGVVASGARFTS